MSRPGEVMPQLHVAKKKKNQFLLQLTNDDVCMIKNKGPACHLLTCGGASGCTCHAAHLLPRGSWWTVARSRWIQVFAERRGVFVLSYHLPALSTPPMGLSPKETEQEEEEEQGWLDRQLL